MTIACLDVSSWRKFTNEERIEYLEKFKSRICEGKNEKNGAALIFREKLKPIDIYSYLKARFGEPNGIQTILRSDDSDNLFHWDYLLKSEGKNVYIVGATRSTHFHMPVEISDEDWVLLLKSLKSDFGRMGREKGQVVKKFEKWVVFQNKFAAIADICAEIHSNISDSPEFLSYKSSSKLNSDQSFDTSIAKSVSERAESLYGDCLKLRLVTPVMAEAFLNLFIITFCKPEVKKDRELFSSFVRAKIPERLDMLYDYCRLMARPIDKTTDAYKEFLRMINKRNDLIHGNMDPIRDQIEVVFFEGKRPIFFEAGDHIGKFFDDLERLYDPSDVVGDYENTHWFLSEIIKCLEPFAVEYFVTIMNDSFPGYEINQMRVTKLFPSYVVDINMTGIRFDDELLVEW